MPRAKIHPDARRRVVQACRQCKASKRKCNASLPCNHCIKRGTADACEMTDDGSSRRARTSTSKDTGSSRNNSEKVSTIQPTSPHTVNWRNDASNIDDGRTHNSIFSPHPSQSNLGVSSPDETRPRMLSNNEGEYVFVGKSAALSFLQLIREAVARRIGPSEFSEHASRDHMLEVDLNLVAGTDQELQLTTQEKQSCLEHYFLAITGLLDVVTPNEAKQLLDNRSCSNSYLAAVKLLVIAIGRQAGPVVLPDEKAIEQCAFAQARLMMFTRMLEDPSLDMIRAFLLLSFYVLGACRRNAAFLYLGVAARAAHTLGLHTVESYSALSDGRRRAQLRCWKSLVSFDLVVSSILGRTTAVLAHRSTGNTAVNITGSIGDHPSMELEACYRLSLIVDSISSHFNGSEPITARVAQSHLQNLNNWSNLLPIQLRPSALPADRTAKTRQSLIGCMHVSCFYYFAVMLVTRPFLIMNITQRLMPNKEAPFQMASANPNEVEELASACLNAATFMSQTCADLLDLDVLEENMCILKAWIFAAGLVLGFELFANTGSNSNLEQAYRSCRRILEKFSMRSPQASQYYDILTLLDAAIEKHKQLQKVRNPSNPVSLVARIMDLHSLGDVRGQVPSSDIPLDAQPHPSVRMNQPSHSVEDLDSLMGNFPTGAGGFSTNLDDFSIPTPESYMFDLQTFGMMPWSLS